MKVGSVPYYVAARLASAAYFTTHGGVLTLNGERTPRTGGLIVASNHMSWLDPPALACAMPSRRLLAMAKEELFAHRLFGWLIGKVGAYPIKRGEADTEAMRFSMSLLEDGHSVIVFPEGTRNDGKTMLPIERGVGMLAKRTGVPVLPAGIHGTQLLKLSGRGNLKRHLVTVAIGEPFRYADVATGRSEKENREIFANELGRRILEQTLRAGLELKSGG